MRDLEQEEPGGTWATPTTMAHNRANGGRSNGGGMAADSRVLTNGSGAGARDWDGEPKSKGDGEDPEVLGGADGASVTDVEAWIWEAVVEPERQRR